MRISKLALLFILGAILLLAFGCAGQKEETPKATTEVVTEETAPVVEVYTITDEDLGTEATCAVCGMPITVAETTPALVYDDAVYYFCSPDEMEQFKADPAKYINVEETIEETAEPAKEATGH